MSSPWKTGHKDKTLQALPEIVKLAKDTLTFENFEEAEKISKMLVSGKKDRKYARYRLAVLVRPPPSRPLMYLMPLMLKLPRQTRDPIRYLGDYIDLLIKEMTFEFVGGKSRTRSLGKNIWNLKKDKAIPSILLDKLERYNNFLYNPGKHDFSLPPGRKHRFTSREVVLTAYITMKLAEEILSISNLAREAVERDDLYEIGGRWGTSRRVEYAGS
jgi:hypothetical protein